MRPGTCRPASAGRAGCRTPLFGPAPCSSRMSSRPSPSASNSAPPPYTDWGMKYLPVGPHSWVNVSPTASVTSSNQSEAPAGASGAELVGVSVRLTPGDTEQKPDRNNYGRQAAGSDGHERGRGSGKSIRDTVTARGMSPQAVAEPVIDSLALDVEFESCSGRRPRPPESACFLCPTRPGCSLPSSGRIVPQSRRRRPCSSPGTPATCFFAVAGSFRSLAAFRKAATATLFEPIMA